MDLAVKFEDFDSTESFLVLDMDKYDLILGMPWLEKHEPWIDWRGKAIGASRPAVSGRALVSNVPTSVRDWGVRDGCQGAYAPEEILGITDSNEDVAMSLATGRETKAHWQACGIATTASPNAESRRAVWASTVAVPDGTDQAGNLGPQAAEAAEESAEGVSCVGNISPQVDNIGPQTGNVVPQTAETVEEDAKGASGVGNIVPRRVEETKQIESAACVSSVGNVVSRGVKKTSTRFEVSLSTSRVDNKVPHSESETPPARPVEEQCHVFDGVSGRQVKAGAVHLEALPEVSALLNLQELSMKDFLAELKAGEIAEMVLLKPETSPEDLNSSSVMDEDVLEGFTKQRATRLGSEILKNTEDQVYPLVKEYSDVVPKHPPSQLPLDRGVRHEIDLVPGTKCCITRLCNTHYNDQVNACAIIPAQDDYSKINNKRVYRDHPRSDLVPPTGTQEPLRHKLWQWPLPREQCEVIDAFFAEKAKSGMWRLVHAYNKLNNATVPAQTPIPRKDVLLNNMSGCTLYSALDRVDGYNQILMRESDIPLTAVSIPSGMLCEWLVMPQGLSNAPATRAEGDQTAMEVHLKHLRRVFEVMRANKLYANIDKCVFAAAKIKVLGCFVSRVGVRADPGKVKAIAAWPTPRSQKDLRKSLGLANYLHNNKTYSAGYAELARPLSDLLKKDADWVWEQQHQDAFDSIKASLQQAPVLALPDENKSFSVV
ncbi:Pol protein [Phytophthora palmivora]|uniref:Pol protein n=1 Tax=Phytophthora palmivora TaxID=4796 RepID=A0A2P4XRY3_9STRA|nr:Pol protein [Phytophthora palmivora]